MISVRAALALVIMSGVSAPAHACMVAIYPNAVIFESEPESQVDGFLVKVQMADIESNRLAWEVRVRVIEGPADLRGRVALLRPEQASSCTTLGRDIGYAIVRRDGRQRGMVRLVGFVFDRSWFDHVSSFFGADPYVYPGDRVEALPF